MEQNAAEILAEQVGNDIRQVINASQMWRASSNSMKYTDLKSNMNKIEKDKVLRQTPFDACLQILGGPGKTSFNDRYDSYFIDYSLLPMMVQENYIDAAKGSSLLKGMDEASRLEKLSDVCILYVVHVYMYSICKSMMWYNIDVYLHTHRRLLQSVIWILWVLVRWDRTCIGNYSQHKPPLP